MKEILWVGVGVDDDDADDTDFEVEEGAIVELFAKMKQQNIPEVRTTRSNGASTKEYTLPEVGTVIDIFDTFNYRMGIGIRVNSIAEGKQRMRKAEAWLRGEGIKLPVSVYAWSPASGVVARIPQP